jgi:hypothetical protein
LAGAVNGGFADAKASSD